MNLEIKPSRRTVKLGLRDVGGRNAATHESIRESNLALVAWQVFQAGGGLNRAEVAEVTGLTKATVSRLVKELLELGILVEGPTDEPSGLGRPGTPLYPAAGTLVGIGAEINIDRLAGVALDLTGNVLDSFQLEGDFVGVDPEKGMAMLSEQISDMLSRLEGVTVVGGTLGIPGIVDQESDSVVYAPNLEWDRVAPLEFMTGRAASIPWGVDNDANLQAIGAYAQTVSESWECPESFLYLTGDVGIGGALVVDGDVVRGPHGWAGEIGHTTVDPEGEDCRCGSRGCLERYTGKGAIALAAGLPSDAPAPDILELLAKGEPKALAAADRAGWALGVAIANAVNLLDLDAVVLGTALAPLLPWTESQLQEQLQLRVVGSDHRDVKIFAAPTDTSPTTMGGALAALSTGLGKFL